MIKSIVVLRPGELDEPPEKYCDSCGDEIDPEKPVVFCGQCLFLSVAARLGDEMRGYQETIWEIH